MNLRMRISRYPRFFSLSITSLLAIAVLLAACGESTATSSTAASTAGATSASTGTTPGAATTKATQLQGTVRLGFFPNLTHPQALVGIGNGLFAQALGSGVKLETKPFNAGPAAVEALLAGELDLTYIGPNPSINA